MSRCPKCFGLNDDAGYSHLCHACLVALEPTPQDIGTLPAGTKLYVMPNLPTDDTALREWGAKLLREMADEHYEKWSINHGILTAKAAELEAGKCAT